MPTNYMLVTIKAKPKHIQRTPDPRAVTMLSKCFYAYHDFVFMIVRVT